MSAPVGIDFGNMHSVMAVARNNGVDILINEVSNRTTPSIVSFGDKQRFIGEDGKTKQVSSVTNTVDNLQTLLGVRVGSGDYERELQYTNAELVENSKGFADVQVNYGGEAQTFTTTQLVAMYLDHLKSIVTGELKADIKDICIAIPTWYTDERRIALLDACRIIGLYNVTVVDTLTAAAAFYGLTKPDLPEPKTKGRIVGFFDSGYSSTSFSVVSFHNGKMKTLATNYVKGLGGRDFDHALAEHFADEFKAKYKIDIRTNAKAYFRVMKQVEKFKKVLSVNKVAQLNIECLMNDIDVSAELTREEFEAILAPLVTKKIEHCLKQTLKHAHVSSLDAIELLGGSSRIPLIKSIVEETTGLSLSSTLNQDEAAVKGAALIAAIFSSTVGVKPFKFRSVLGEDITLMWDNPGPSGADAAHIMSKDTHYPTTRSAVIKTAGDFVLTAHHGKKQKATKEMAQLSQSLLGLWKVYGIDHHMDKKKKNATALVELIVSCNVSRLLQVDEAYLVEVDESAKEDKAGGPRYKRLQTLAVDSMSISPYEDKIMDWADLERLQHAQDDLVKETEEKKNELESSIYSLRARLEETYNQVVTEQEKKNILGLLSNSEDWLYGDGEDSTLEEYTVKYAEVQNILAQLQARL